MDTIENNQLLLAVDIVAHRDDICNFVRVFLDDIEKRKSSSKVQAIRTFSKSFF